MTTDFFSGVFAAFACIGLGALIALAWRGTRPEPPPPSDYDEFTAPDYPPVNYEQTYGPGERFSVSWQGGDA